MNFRVFLMGFSLLLLSSCMTISSQREPTAVDQYNNEKCITKVKTSLYEVEKVELDPLPTRGEYFLPHYVEAENGNVFLSSYKGFYIFNANNNSVRRKFEGSFSAPVRGKDGMIITSNYNDGSIQIFNPDGHLERKVATREPNVNFQIHIANNGNIIAVGSSAHVSGSGVHRTYILNQGGQLITQFTLPSYPGDSLIDSNGDLVVGTRAGFVHKYGTNTNNRMTNNGMFEETIPVEVPVNSFLFAEDGSFAIFANLMSFNPKKLETRSRDRGFYVFNSEGKLNNKLNAPLPGPNVYNILRRNDNSFVLSSKDGFLYTVHPNGTLNKSVQFKGEAISGKVISGEDGALYVATTPINEKGHHTEQSSFINELDSDGNFKKRFETKGRVTTGPVFLEDENIMVGTMGGYLYVFQTDGTLKVKSKISDQDISGAWPLKNGNILVHSADYVKGEGQLTVVRISKEPMATSIEQEMEVRCPAPLIK